MPRFTFTSTKLMVTIAAVTVLGATAVAAYAAIPSKPQKVFTACYKKSNGAVRLVDSKKKCAKGEARTTWNQAGVKGAPGAAGVAGPAGAAGAPGATGAPATKLWAVVSYPAGLLTNTPSIARTSGGATVTAGATGIFDIKFAQDISQCAAIVTANAPTGASAELIKGYATTEQAGPVPADTVRVRTFDKNGDLSIRPAHVAVFC